MGEKKRMNPSVMTVRLLVTGSRGIVDARMVNNVLDQTMLDLGGRSQIQDVIHGDAKGVDTLAGEWAAHYRIPVIKVAPTGPRHEKKSWAIRDRRMVDEFATHVVAIWDGTSPGTRITWTYAQRRGKLIKCWLAKHVEEELGLRYETIAREAAPADDILLED
jgi:hypothetical protein